MPRYTHRPVVTDCTGGWGETPRVLARPDRTPIPEAHTRRTRPRRRRKRGSAVARVAVRPICDRRRAATRTSALLAWDGLGLVRAAAEGCACDVCV